MFVKEAVMNTVKANVVREVIREKDGNVYRCTFGRETAAVIEAPIVPPVATDIRSDVAEINQLIREVAATNAGIAEQGAANSQILLDAISKLDSVAFQATLLAHGVDHPIHSEVAAVLAADVRHCVGEGAVAARRLRELVNEQQLRAVSFARALQEISDEVAALEVITSTRVGPLHPGATLAG